jgi:hypothetical protein
MIYKGPSALARAYPEIDGPSSEVRNDRRPGLVTGLQRAMTVDSSMRVSD